MHYDHKHACHMPDMGNPVLAAVDITNLSDLSVTLSADSTLAHSVKAS